MSKRRARFLIICIAVTVGIVCSLATFCIIKLVNKDRVYISPEQYEVYMKLYDIEEIYGIIEENYYDELDEEKLISGALAGMVSALEDPYSKYYTQAEFVEFKESYDGTYVGIGISGVKDDATGYIVIQKVFKDTPAEQAGLKTGDVITKIDGTDVAQLSVSEALSIISDSAAATTQITILKDGTEKVCDVDIKTLQKETVSSVVFGDNLGYIKLSEFTGKCVDDFKAALETLKNTKGLVIDLRYNSGGVVEYVQQIADMLLDECVIAYSENKGGERTAIKATAGTDYTNKVVVLVNGYTASAAEMLSAALSENGRASIVGTQTYGKGVIQSIIKIPSTNAGLKITTSSYYSPKGNVIQGVGVTPDYVVEDVNKQITTAAQLLSE